MLSERLTIDNLLFSFSESTTRRPRWNELLGTGISEESGGAVGTTNLKSNIFFITCCEDQLLNKTPNIKGV